MTSTNAHVLIYTRISQDREGIEAGVGRQRDDCLALARRLGLNVESPRVFEDNDRGASNLSRKRRDGYDAMVKLAHEYSDAGDDVVILGYSTSRLTRRPREFFDLIDLCKSGHVTIRTVVSGDLNFNTADGRAQASTVAIWDAAEAERIGERVRRANTERAKAGQPHGRPAYGWRRMPRADVLDEAEAAVLREAYTRVMKDESLYAIAADFHARGIPHPAQGWKPRGLRQMLLRERNAGRRRHRGEDVGAAAWEALWSVEEQAAIRAKLTDPVRGAGTKGRPVTHLLSGLLTCGLCGGGLYGTGRARYACSSCHRIVRNEAKTDAYIVDVVVDALSSPDAGALFGGQPDVLAAAEREVAVLRGRLDEAADLFAEGAIDASHIKRLNARLRPKLVAAEQRAMRAAPVQHAHLVGSDVDVVRAMWDKEPLAVQRAVIRTMLTVTIYPSTSKNTRVYDYDSVHVVFNG